MLLFCDCCDYIGTIDVPDAIITRACDYRSGQHPLMLPLPAKLTSILIPHGADMVTAILVVGVATQPHKLPRAAAKV